ncbi:hypothetical protein LguiA_014726 [Lonicera macranthoides]
MRSHEKKQSKLRHYAGAPRRFLRKARDFYVESMVSLDGMVGSPPIPKNFGGTTRKENSTTNNSEGLKELPRSASERSIGGRAEFARRQSMAGAVGGRVERSYSVGLGRIGTIDEESPCDFGEEKDAGVNIDFLFSRSRSSAINAKRNVGFY